MFRSTSPTLSKNVTQSADDFKVNPASEIIFVHKELRKTKANKAIALALVVQRLDNTIHRINRYPADKC